MEPEMIRECIVGSEKLFSAPIPDPFQAETPDGQIQIQIGAQEYVPVLERFRPRS